jgi:undecaprenyl pyrophosphate phosphatase UppP
LAAVLAARFVDRQVKALREKDGVRCLRGQLKKEMENACFLLLVVCIAIIRHAWMFALPKRHIVDPMELSISITIGVWDVVIALLPALIRSGRLQQVIEFLLRMGIPQGN